MATSYYDDGSLRWNGSHAYHPDGQLAWNGSHAYHANGCVAWNGHQLYYEDGQLAWNGTYAYKPNGSVDATAAVSRPMPLGNGFLVIAKDGGKAQLNIDGRQVA